MTNLCKLFYFFEWLSVSKELSLCQMKSKAKEFSELKTKMCMIMKQIEEWSMLSTQYVFDWRAKGWKYNYLTSDNILRAMYHCSFFKSFNNHRTCIISICSSMCCDLCVKWEKTKYYKMYLRCEHSVNVANESYDILQNQFSYLISVFTFPVMTSKECISKWTHS